MVVLFGSTRHQTLLVGKIVEASPVGKLPANFLKVVVMDCQKLNRNRNRNRNRLSALLQTAASIEIPKLVGGEPASTNSASVNPVVCNSALSKLPAKFMLAVLPAIALACCICVTSRTVHGQASTESREVEVQQLIEQLTQTDYDLRESAEHQLIEIGSPAVDLLVRTLLDCTPDVCSRVKRILQAVAGECDEESLFKVLAVLRIRFEVPAQRIKPLLDRWAIKSRGAAVAQWRRQGAIVMDRFEHSDPMLQLDEINDIENQMRLRMAQGQAFRFEVEVNKPDVVKSKTRAESPHVIYPDKREAETRSISERLQLVLDGSLEQNKKLVLSSRKGAVGFDKSLAMLQKQPVSVVIGEDWRGDYSDFDFTGSRSDLLINSFTVEKKVITDSLLAVLNKHPIVTLTLNECSVAANLKQSFPNSLTTLVIEGADNSTEIFDLIPNNGPALMRVRFVDSKFGETQAAALKRFKRLVNIELFAMDLEEDAFEGLASLRWLRALKLERCKFPTAAFLDFQRERREVGVEFTAKAFLGVSSDSGIMFRQGRRFQPPALDKEGCVVATVVPGEAADRAGMKAGDEILTVGGQKVKSFEELRIAIAQCEIGEQVAILIRRDGKKETLKATMGIPNHLE